MLKTKDWRRIIKSYNPTIKCPCSKLNASWTLPRGCLHEVTAPYDLVAKDIIDFIPEDRQEEVRKKIVFAHKFGKPSPMIEEDFVTAKGNPVTVEVVAIPYQYSGKRAVQIVAQDITEKNDREGT